MVEVELSLAPSDWDALRSETRSLWDTFSGDCLAEPFDSPFDWTVASATIDGVDLGPVGLRKKGFFGSLDRDRPSLKLALDRVQGDTGYGGFTKLTLNNGDSDPTGLRTCLAYETYAAAGVLTPRCTLAHVVVNGEDLGVYANVEPVDEDFLTRRGLSPEGGLFEGALSDFRDGWTTTFDPKTDTSDVGRLGRVVAAIDTGDLDAIAEVVDLDAYLDFWATEVLVGQWDSYDTNTNNFFVYDDPSTGQLRFIPWGPDATFDSQAPFDPAWVSANSALARRVLAAPGGEDAYRAHLEALLDDVWDGDAMAAEVDRLALLAEPLQGDGGQGAVQDLRAIVEGREAALRAGLAAEPNGRTGALRDPPCFVERGKLTATFATTWGTLGEAPAETGSTTVQLTWDGADLGTTPKGVIAGAQGEEAVIATYATLSDGRDLVAYAYFPVEQLAPGRLPFDFLDVVGVLQFADGASPPKLAAYVGAGQVVLDDAGPASGDVVRGRVEGTLFSFGW